MNLLSLAHKPFDFVVCEAGAPRCARSLLRVNLRDVHGGDGARAPVGGTPATGLKKKETIAHSAQLPVAHGGRRAGA